MADERIARRGGSGHPLVLYPPRQPIAVFDGPRRETNHADQKKAPKTAIVPRAAPNVFRILENGCCIFRILQPGDANRQR